MGLFGKKRELSPLLPGVNIEAGLDNPVNFDTVLDYLVGLNRYDFDRIIKVAGIYRAANKDAFKVLGVKDEPTAVITKETREKLVLTDSDEISFMLDDEPALPKKPKTKVKVKKD